MKRIAFVGAGTHLHSVYDSMDLNEYEVVGCLDNLIDVGEEAYAGIKVLGKLFEFDVLKEHQVDAVMICIGDLVMRERLLEAINEYELEMFTVIDKSAIVSEYAYIHDGTFIGKGAIVNANCEIGEGCIINSGSIVEHDCYLESNVHVAPGAVVCGSVRIYESTLVGANSTIIQGLEIGAHATIGAGSTVIRNVDGWKTVVGSPGKEIK